MSTNMKIEDDLKNILKTVAKSENIGNYEFVTDNKGDQGDGFLSDFFTGEILNKDNGKITRVAIKKAPVSEFNADFQNTDFYYNENYFYSEAFPTLDKYQKEKGVKCPFNHIPRYLAGNRKSENMFVAMENVKPEYVLFDKKKYFDSEHLELIFKTYGKFHALSFSFKRDNVEEYENLVIKFREVMKKAADLNKESSIFFVNFLKKFYLAALDTFDPVTESDILTKLHAVEDIGKGFSNVVTYRGPYKCLVHGDCWSNNMLFKYKESGDLEDIKLIDFQLPRSSSPVHDLSYFFYSGASKKDMDKLDYYLDLYYQSFSSFTRELGGIPEEMFPLDALKRDWKEYAFWGVLMGCQLWMIKLTDKSEIKESLNQNGHSEESFAGLFSEERFKEAEFRKRIKNIYLHAVEYGVI